MSLYLRGKWWWYKFSVKGHLICGTTRTTERDLAEKIEATCRKKVAKKYGVVMTLPKLTPRSKSVLFRGYIYFVTCTVTGRIKIGLSWSAKSRLAGLQCGSPTRLVVTKTVRGMRRDERFLHAQFKDSRLHGEWFEPSKELLATIESIQDFPARDVTGQPIQEPVRKRKTIEVVDPYNRDPRVDPMPGDRLARKRGRFPEREVSDIDERSVYWVSDRTCEVKIRLAGWKRWAKDAEVLHAAKRITR